MIPVETAEELWKVHERLQQERINEQLTITDLKDGNLYLARHKMHSTYGRPRMTRQEVLNYTREMNWKPEDMIIELANFPYSTDKKTDNSV